MVSRPWVASLLWVWMVGRELPPEPAIFEEGGGLPPINIFLLYFWEGGEGLTPLTLPERQASEFQLPLLRL